MTAPEFGTTPPPAEQRRGEHRFAYVARHRACGHIAAIQADTSDSAVDELVRRVAAYRMTFERIPYERAVGEGLGQCGRCKPPEQRGMGL